MKNGKLFETIFSLAKLYRSRVKYIKDENLNETS